ncbi:longitudinals lacking protein, isoforms H/M/V-like isoform X1 [Maniola jurtina]|uniref:longitudinals lacking protein, isoforms H/M/V-like isoform X1 n=1 Tax=Maniola jurtina TaxID=191418 RepID=UPI001E68FA9A|nr:longitudinals lacking protein, isoforms H/M/V-like isoform X1 [Maniola jurtina]XP_045784113.1 longitudinals lacking protein, isoforms H/M/V-like isoform X1 [Maniola jurtina]XP_045784115.1 longitudinals lacking protein, isoforms H/M/V-like isoform X1 [Maniola jurtina]
MSQQYSLRWNNHQPNFISMFGNLLVSKNLVDVTLAAEGQHLVAHKVVLSACSTYFHSLFVDNPSHHPIVILKDVTFNDLRTMVDFMYYGEVNVTEEQLPQVLETAKILKIKGLTEMPDSTSLTRSQGSATDFSSVDNTNETQRSAVPSVSPSSPSTRRKRRRKSSSGSMNLVTEDNRSEDGTNIEMMREAVTLSSVPQQKRRELDERMDNPQQAGDPTNINIDQLAMDTNAVGMSQGQWSMLEHTYPRYSNACLGGGGLQPDQGMYLNNVINPHGDPEMNHYGQALGVPGPAPGPSCVAEAQTVQAVNQTPQKRRRATNPQAEENFQRALEAVRFGGIGFCKAARMFGVNNRTLWLEYKKKGYPNNRPSIKSRIKREHVTPPPEQKDEQPHQEQQMALLCPPHPVPVGFIDPRPVDFPLQVNNSPLNIINGVNFPMQ